MGRKEDDNEEAESFSSDDEEDKEEAEKCIKHYSSSQRILLVGEGDFSFSLSLAKAFGSAHNMVATSLDTQGIISNSVSKRLWSLMEVLIFIFYWMLWTWSESLARKYSDGIENVRQLEARSCLVLHGVDATQMSPHFFLRTQRFDRIIYNFPHVGFHYKEASYCQIQLSNFPFFFQVHCHIFVYLIETLSWIPYCKYYFVDAAIVLENLLLNPFWIIEFGLSLSMKYQQYYSQV